MNKKKRLMPYIGYGKPNTIILMGSVLYSSAVKDAKKEDSKWRNSKKMLQLFLAKPTVNEQVTILFHNHSKTITTDKNGYFKTTLQLTSEIKAGWHSVSYYLNKDTPFEVSAENKCIIIDESVSLGVISDIDDTIVVSHSHRYRKKIWTALSKNAMTRKPNKTLSKFYNKLRPDKNPFFYVSSSERNLYGFWSHFMKTNNFPSGPLLLKELKYGFTDFIFSGKGKHHHKYEKITGILDFYPFLSFILVGDNGQKDVEIYHSIVLNFPERIKSIFIVPTVDKRLNKKIVADCKKHNVNILTINNSIESLNNALKEACL
ncbi:MULTISPECIES: phosphatase domain-containing protein [unclassified Maribacter]|uniref:phosphatase domain-containing protein n=1 Tax=unclassified Maribacter TaxID=2615042 RepID=UPI00257DDAE7|nr:MULTISPECIES: phosphatase domain-containing protein [unclassified Maribacter]|tara:strand:- start:6527 stop:7477 length:951 start_codon:yes stop_codon:yes gene_type:complete